MLTKKTNVFELFESKKQYLVPIFQRGYVWTQSGLCKRLWEDLVEQTEGVHAARGGPEYRRSHFLGAIVLSPALGRYHHVPTVDIIDGQQRLLTLLVLLAAIRDTVSDLVDDYTRSELEGLTRNADPVPEPDEGFKVWPTNAYREDLRRTLLCGSPTALAKQYPQRRYYRKMVPERPKLVDAYLYFADRVREFVHEPPDTVPDELIRAEPAERADSLVKALTRHIQPVIIELEPDDDAQVIFESLNFLAVPLEPSDLVRNLVFLSATRHGENVDKLYSETWRRFDEERDVDNRPFWKAYERQGRLRRSRLDLFLFHFVTYKTGEEVKIGDLFQEFKLWWDSHAEGSARQSLVELVAFSDSFKRLLQPVAGSPLGHMAFTLHVLDTTTVYPLVLWYLDPSTGVSDLELGRIFKVLESYLVRRAVCGLGQKNYNKAFVMLLGRLRSAGTPTAVALSTELAALTGESSLWPTDDEFRRHLTQDPLYRSLGAGRTEFVLRQLDQAFRPGFAEQVDVKGQLTIEHVRPQGAKEDDWPLELGEGDIDEAMSRRERLTHSLGNLTLLTQPLNSSVGRGPYVSKRGAIAKQSLLALNSYFQQQESWSEADIVERGAVLAAKAVDLWSRP